MNHTMFRTLLAGSLSAVAALGLMGGTTAHAAVGGDEHHQRAKCDGAVRRGGASGHRVGGHGGRPRCLAGGQLDGELIAADLDHLHDCAQQQAHQRQRESELDRCLAAVVCGRAVHRLPFRVCRSQLVDDRVDDSVEQAAHLAGAAAGGGPADDEQRDQRGAEQHERVLGGGLAVFFLPQVASVQASDESGHGGTSG